MAGVVHDAVQQAVMQYGYDNELYQAWRDGKIGEKDFLGSVGLFRREEF